MDDSRCTVVSALFPFLQARFAECTIKGQISEIERRSWESYLHDSRAQLPLTVLARFADDEKARRAGIEDKAKKNLIGVTVAVSLLAVGLSFMGRHTAATLAKPIVTGMAGFLVCVASLFLICAALAALKALRLGPISSLDFDDEARGEGGRAAVLVYCLDLNERRTTVRANWTDASDLCIRNALTVLVALVLLAMASMLFSTGLADGTPPSQPAGHSTAMVGSAPTPTPSQTSATAPSDSATPTDTHVFATGTPTKEWRPTDTATRTPTLSPTGSPPGARQC